ncbi:MAG: hypothetical protein H0X72_08645 [Acidobacteria bacterium]|jgi:predicted Zn-dependent protease|nr:hypothetical protein [Acidobacteriota bacterium]
MNSKMQAVKLVTVLVAFFAVIIFPINSYATHSWSGYHWARTANPFTLTVVDSNTADWQSYFNTSNADWNSSSVLNLSAVPGDESSNARKRCVMITGKIHSCNASYGSNGWLGLASINITGGVHITQGSSKMNDTYFSTSTYNNPNERLHVMCQEIGHTFGLDHQSTDGSSQNSCMDYFSNTGANATSTASTHPNSHDYAELVDIYTHLDSTTTIGFAAFSSSASEVTDDPNSWGRLTSQSANGRGSTYEREHFDGSKTATHVFWTREVAENCPGCDHRYQ